MVEEEPRRVAPSPCAERGGRRRLSLHGRVVVITGGARGIGLATARRAVSRGASVALVDRDGDEARRAAECLGPAALGVEADVTDPVALRLAVSRIAEALGGIDVLVANAGVPPTVATVERGDRAAHDRVIDVNLRGTWNTIDAVLGEVVARRGHVLLVSSMMAFMPSPFGAAYGASKAAVEALARALRVELAPAGVTVGVGHFGLVRTELIDGVLGDADYVRFAGQVPGALRSRVSAERVGRAIVAGVERRSPRTLVPGWLWAAYLLRGVVGPALDAVYARRPAAREAAGALRAGEAARAAASEAER